jgi:hypothetical protein
MRASSDCYASFRVSAQCYKCGKYSDITHVAGDLTWCPEHCPVCSQEGERRRGAKKGGTDASA